MIIYLWTLNRGFTVLVMYPLRGIQMWAGITASSHFNLNTFPPDQSARRRERGEPAGKWYVAVECCLGASTGPRWTRDVHLKATGPLGAAQPEPSSPLHPPFKWMGISCWDSNGATATAGNRVFDGFIWTLWSPVGSCIMGVPSGGKCR